MVTERMTPGARGAAPPLRPTYVVPAWAAWVRAAARPVAAFAVGIGGLVGVVGLYGPAWSWVLWIAVGALAGLVAARPAHAWLGALAVVALLPISAALGLPRDTGPFWYLGVLLGIAFVTTGFLAGANLRLGRAPLAAFQRWWRSLRRGSRRVVALVAAVALVGLAGYSAYAGAIGSQEFVHAAKVNTDCRTPAARYGWDYEAINYDKADDARLAAESPGMTDCRSQGTLAGTEVVSSDGVRLAGWYIPSASGTGPQGPTVVIAHGWKSNKSEVLKYAVAFHDRFNIVIPDLRNSGRSGVADTTMGVREQLDVRAMVDWLVRTKNPRWIGAMGNSMGGATALAEATGDPRIAAIVLDSLHAQLVVSGGNIVETEFGHPSVPASWAITIATSLRLGTDVTAIDPVRMITRMGTRPVLLLHGTADVIDRPDQSADVNFHAALAAGVPVDLHYCRGAPHGLVIDTCPAEWASWANWFFAQAGAA